MLSTDRVNKTAEGSMVAIDVVPSFSELIHSARIQKNLTVRALEGLLEERGGQRVSRTYISFLETGKRKPTYEVAFALSEVLGIDKTTALASAFQARRNFDLIREMADLKALLDSKGLTNLEIDELVA